jgi:hypothetical protein
VFLLHCGIHCHVRDQRLKPCLLDGVASPAQNTIN